MLDLDPIINDSVFLKFKDSLLPCSQLFNFTISLFKSSLSMERYCDEWEIVMPLVYIVIFPLFKQNGKSLK